MERKPDSDDILRLFYNSFKIPAGIFDRSGKLQKLFFNSGTKLTKLYLTDVSFVLQKHKAGSAEEPAVLLLEVRRSFRTLRKN